MSAAGYSGTPLARKLGFKDGMRAVRDGTQLETNLQNGPLELGMAVQVAVDQVQGRPIPTVAMFIMPEITKQNVAHYYGQMFVDPKKFITDLPALVKFAIRQGMTSV